MAIGDCPGNRESRRIIDREMVKKQDERQKKALGILSRHEGLI
jgi:hypothetical protein